MTELALSQAVSDSNSWDESDVNSPKAMRLVLCYSGPMLSSNVDSKFAGSQKNFSKGNYLRTSLLNLFNE